MKKKILAIMLSVIMVFVFAACGDSESPQKSEGSGSKDSPNSNIESRQDSGTEVVGGKTNSDDEMEKFSETLTFMGFNFNYPQSVNVQDYTYGYTFRYNTDICVLLEAPSKAGVLMDITDINDTVTASEQYVFKTLESRTAELFDVGTTIQTVTNSEVKTINDIEMLRVEGFFTNTWHEIDVPYVGYYFLMDTDPIYFVAVSINEDVTVDAFIDEFAGYVEDLLK